MCKRDNKNWYQSSWIWKEGHHAATQINSLSRFPLSNASITSQKLQQYPALSTLKRRHWTWYRRQLGGIELTMAAGDWRFCLESHRNQVLYEGWNSQEKSSCQWKNETFKQFNIWNMLFTYIVSHPLKSTLFIFLVSNANITTTTHVFVHWNWISFIINKKWTHLLTYFPYLMFLIFWLFVYQPVDSCWLLSQVSSERDERHDTFKACDWSIVTNSGSDWSMVGGSSGHVWATTRTRLYPIPGQYTWINFGIRALHLHTTLHLILHKAEMQT